MLNTSRRHGEWKAVYETVIVEKYLYARDQLHKTEQQASKFARQKAEQAVVDNFPKPETTRAVRDAMNDISPYSDLEYLKSTLRHS